MCESQHPGGGHTNGAISKVVCLVVPRGVPSGGAGKGAVPLPLLVENGTLWRIRGNFGGVSDRWS